MEEPVRSPGVIRFGIFEVDLRAGELRKKGLKIKLQDQPFQILAILLERPGEVVTREELRQELWSDDTFVDFDHSLNIAINSIRQALDDSAENPRFIETLPRRGYRFIAPVDNPSQASPPLITASIPASPIKGKPIPSALYTQNRWLNWWTLTLACVMSVAAVFLIFWLRNSPAPSPRIVPLTSFPGYKESPTFSPDGNQLAFVWDGGGGDNLDIYVKLIDAGKSLRLTSNPGLDFSPAWSPDGRQIAFLRWSPTSQGIYVIPSLGGPERRLADSFSGSGLNVGLDWSPDGKLLAVSDMSSPQDAQCIFLFSLENGGRRKITFPPPSHPYDAGPKFSPDGKNLAFIRGSGSYSMASDIYVVPSGGGAPKRLTFDNRWIFALAWTWDSQEIVFSSNRKGLFSLWKIPASGGTPEALAAVGEDAYFPSISRQGNQLAYVRWRMDFNIWRTDGPSSTAQHHAPVKLISSTREDAYPDISPDGKKITFVSDQSGATEIWVCDSEGQNPSPLTSFGGPQTGAPHWSPDGRHIVFYSYPFGHGDIFVVGTERRGLRRLTTETSDDWMPSWSRDGQWIYFSSNRSGTTQVWKMPAEGGKPVMVTKHGGDQPLESSDGKFLYYFKHAQGIGAIWRVPVEGGEETCILRHQAWHWSVLGKTICLFNLQALPQPAIELFDINSGRRKRIATIEQKSRVVPSEGGLAVSPDGQWILFGSMDQLENDIMLVENFRGR